MDQTQSQKKHIRCHHQTLERLILISPTYIPGTRIVSRVETRVDPAVPQQPFLLLHIVLPPTRLPQISLPLFLLREGHVLLFLSALQVTLKILTLTYSSSSFPLSVSLLLRFFIAAAVASGPRPVLLFIGNSWWGNLQN